MNNVRIGCGSVLVLVILLIGWAAIQDAMNPLSTENHHHCPPIGEDGHISGIALSGNSEHSLDEATQALVNKDQIGLQQMLESGQAAYIPTGTTIHLLGHSGLLGCICKVRVMDGDYVGEIRYVPFEVVQK